MIRERSQVYIRPFSLHDFSNVPFRLLTLAAAGDLDERQRVHELQDEQEATVSASATATTTTTTMR